MSSRSRVHIQIFGRVQGVNFRHYARQRAESLGLAGWVRNCPDGSVEAVAEGPDESVQQFVQWTHQGPSMADVERVHVNREEPTGESHAFRIAR